MKTIKAPQTITAALAMPAHVEFPSVFVGAAPNADDSHHDVGKWKEVETDDNSGGQAGENRSDGSRLRENVGDGAIGDGVVPKGLAERKIASPKRF